MEEVIERKTIQTDTVNDRGSVVSTDEPVVAARHPATKLIQFVYFLTGLIVALLGIRFILQLLGASPASGFVQLVYNLTEPLVAPFYGVFRTTIEYGVARLELESLLAMLIYTLIGWGIASLIRIAAR